MTTFKSATDAAGHIVKLLNPGVPYPMQSVGAQKVTDYVKLRDAAITQVLCDLLEGEKAIHSQLAGEWTGIKTDGTRTSINPHLEQFDAFTKAQALIRQTLDPISNQE